MTEPLIRIQGITKVFNTEEFETHALSSVHLDIARGEFVSIEGPSGSGKTTLLSILGLLETADGGSYRLDGLAVEKLDAEAAAASASSFSTATPSRR